MKTIKAGLTFPLVTILKPAATNRLFVVFGAVLIQLCLGVIYAWSVFTPHLKVEPFNFTSTDAGHLLRQTRHLRHHHRPRRAMDDTHRARHSHSHRRAGSRAG